VLAVLLLAGCGQAASTARHSAATSRLSSVSDVRRSFSHRGIRLENAPVNPFATGGPTYLTAAVPGATTIPAKAPYAPQPIPLFVDVQVYSSAEQARVGGQTDYTIGSAGPLHKYRVRNVLVRWQGYGPAPRVEAAVRGLR
jgi:hypothetical protein